MSKLFEGGVGEARGCADVVGVVFGLGRSLDDSDARMGFMRLSERGRALFGDEGRVGQGVIGGK